MRKAKTALSYSLLFITGGLIYLLIEVLFRGWTHWSMFLVGGLCYLEIGLINELFPWSMALTSQMLISALVITANEFVSGVILNLWLGWGVWDYTHMPYNLLGQVCLLFTVLWFLLSPLPIVLDDWMKYGLRVGEKPRYKIL